MAKPECNTPQKKPFRDRIAAALHAADGVRLGREAEPYRCPCGKHWHVRTIRAKGGTNRG